MADQEEYDQLRFSVAAHPDRAPDLKRYTDTGNLLVYGVSILGFGSVNLLILFSPLLAWASFALGGGSVLKTIFRDRKTGIAQPDDTEQVKDYRAAFNKAAMGYKIGQTASIGLMLLSTKILERALGSALSGGDGLGTMFFAVLTAAAAAETGWRAYFNAEKMSVYKAAIEVTKNPPLPSSPPAPDIKPA